MTEPASNVPNVVEIRKYPNRRYYDTSRSTHVTLEEIYTMIRDGKEVRVVDSKTDQDITAKVLAQIILDLDAPKLGIFPVPLLHRLIRSNEQIVTDFVEKYFNKALNAFLDSQRGFEQYLRQAMGLQPPPSGLPDWTKMMWGTLAPWAPRPETPPVQPGQPDGNGPPAATNGGGGRSQEDLRREVNDLRDQVAQLRHSKRTAARKPARKRPGK